jgi:tetratricopeptide (TPR) repeat protein
MPEPESVAEARARELHRRGVELTGSGRSAAGARALRAGLRLLGWTGPDQGTVAGPVTMAAQVARMLVSLSLNEVELGRADAGFALLDLAETMVAPADRGALAQQRGVLYVLTGHMDEALGCLDEAVALLSRSGDEHVLAATLLNRGVVHHNAGRIGLARADLVRCERVARRLGRELLLAKVAHNHGHCALLTGDVLGALRQFDQAAAWYATAAPGPLLGTVSMDRARVLLAAGLVTEAGTELGIALSHLHRRGASRDRAEAELTQAQVALATGDWAAARAWAARAGRRFRSQGNVPWAAVSALARLSADFGQRRHLAATADAAQQLSAELHKLGLDNDADTATLLSARAYTATGRDEQATAAVQGCRPRTSVDNQLRRRLALAELCASRGDPGGALRHCRLGLAALARHQGRFGSLDLRTGSAALGVELAGAGLEIALAGGSAVRVYSWLERSRAQSFRATPVRPPQDRHTLDAVAELRHLAREVRAAELAGTALPAARRRCAELERGIRARGWLAEGDGHDRRTAGFAEVVAELSGAGSALVSYVVHGGHLLAVVVTERGGRLFPLGEWAVVAEAVARLHRDLDALCDLALPPALGAVVRTSAHRQAALLAELLLAPLWPVLGDRDLVLVPTRTLSAVPWGVLPGLRGRPVTVAPSASAWWHGRRDGADHPGSAGAVAPLVVAGPYLEHAPAEVRAVAGVYPDAVELGGDTATVAAVLERMDGRAVVHIAAHGHHEQDNVLFSRLDLVDGPLMAYDVQQLRVAPAHVVLPACDIGRTVVRTGDELLGFTAALLYVGTRTVVSCVNRVLDDSAVGIMAAYHRGLAAGRRPARALADACADDPLTPFVCFGAG